MEGAVGRQFVVRQFVVVLTAASTFGTAATLSPNARGVKRYDVASHEPVRSVGCGKDPPYTVGNTTVAHGTYKGIAWTYNVYLPTGYSKHKPFPVVLQFPGWGVSADHEEAGCGITARADELDLISVTPQGMNDNPRSGGPWHSWNAVGSTQSPGRAGPTCTEAASSPSYCYTSCGNCTDEPQCDWTTCADTITPTGTGKVDADGFIHSLYDTLEEQLCIDTSREYGAGESNGGMMAYQTGVAIPERLAALFPQFGSFHRGFNLAPTIGLPVMALHGIKDSTVPANASLSSDGYYFTPTDEIFGGNEWSTGWSQSNNCTGERTVYETSLDGKHELWCLSEGNCPGGDVVRCSWHGGHTWFGKSAEDNGKLVTEFLLKWTRPSHIGRGYSFGDQVGEPLLLQDFWTEPASGRVRGVAAELLHGAAAELAPGPASHYGDPALGCMPDEAIVYIGHGRACAPKIGVERLGSPDGQPPVPQCQIGGLVPRDNGCPRDAVNTAVGSIAFPVCLAKGPSPDPYMDGFFHCMLTCPCYGAHAQCGNESDAHCPRGATCHRGELLNQAWGVCSYDVSVHVPAPLLVL